MGNSWQPISTAPKDIDILVYREGRQYVARWRPGYETWGVSVDRIPGEPGPFTEIGDIGFEGHFAARGPTHWMHLAMAPDSQDISARAALDGGEGE